jgi:hypothetical protein
MRAQSLQEFFKVFFASLKRTSSDCPCEAVTPAEISQL